jgi:hypothetical protein
MNCPDPITLSNWFDTELPDDARAHVATCAHCRALLDDFAAVRRAMQEARPRERAGDLAGVLARPRRRALIPAFAIVALIIAALFLHRRPARDEGALSQYDGGGRAVIWVGSR